MTRRPPAIMIVLALVASAFTVASVGRDEPDLCGPGVEAQRIDGLVVCTHGNDEPPPGVDTTELPTTAELLVERFGTDDPEVVESEFEDPVTVGAGSVACVGDGVSGARVQLVYARASNVASRYSSVLPLIRQYASDADDMLNVSAGRVGDGRRVRFVTNSACDPTVMNIQLSRTGDDSFGNMVTELRNKGLTHVDRKYLVFMDAAVGICGLGEVYLNDRGDDANPNNTGRAMYARVDTSCWKHAAAHELIHTLGAVQNSAPNASGYGHCTDEVDVMCYRDSSTTVTRQVCSRAGQVDCQNNDYYHPNPRSGTYLAQKWNVARSRYLASTAPPPPPSETSISVPWSAYAGLPLAVRAAVRTSTATIVWSSSRRDCWFARPRALKTTWTCPATATGAAEITAHITEGGITTPYTRATSLVVPATKLRPNTLTRTSRKTITVGRRVAVVGRVTDMGSGAAVAGLPVVVQARTPGTRTWRNVAWRRTNRRGAVRVVTAPSRNTAYRVRSGVNSTWAVSASTGRGVGVRTRMSTAVNTRHVAGYMTTAVRSGTVTRLTGRVSPNKARRIVRLQVLRNRTWRTVASKRLTRTSRYVFRYRLRTRGVHRLRVVKPGDRLHVGSRRVVRVKAY